MAAEQVGGYATADPLVPLDRVVGLLGEVDVDAMDADTVGAALQALKRVKA